MKLRNLSPNVRETTTGESNRHAGHSRWRGWFLAVGATGIGAWITTHMLCRSASIDWSGKRVLVNIGARGLGLACARALAARGAQVVICGSDRAELHRAFTDLAPRTERIMALLCDLSQRSQVERMKQLIEEQWGGVDVLVNHANTTTIGPHETMTVEDFERAINE